MSLPRFRSSLSSVCGVLLCGLMLAPATACHRGASATQQPSPATEGVSERRFPGVDVIRTLRGGVRIRILSGVASGGEPLYVVDGTPVTVQPGRGLDWLAPEQIARIDVLKYPAETAIYGARGVNGVLIITTRRDR
jgi:TonB-dependent SusC/RagA subfamily outer membrane receptor